MQFKEASDGGYAYTTIDGDVVDLVAFNFYGHHVGTTEIVLEANPGLASRSAYLPAGVVIRLPNIKPPVVEQELISLWD